MTDNYAERLWAIDHEEASPIHQGELERLRESLENLVENLVENLAANRRRYPAGLPVPGRCYCATHEMHDGKCLGPDCYCH